ncbi:melanophilin-like isoform X3 [Brienomyrus brachyistius]|uniref:melanophilin-like isoform X3 n=1 Tax=Brienomyrus brachyistius TaxID=42636 RepID=UPI0020B26D30|nr:melanophilin-like isoform X3 [Brienomyrus brachyistius]
MNKKLDLSKLTDEEAKHVWKVLQRDMELRKTEENRLGDLKTKIEKEDSKRELLASQPSLTASYCIHCLQPFKFLVNSRRQCADCKLYMCKSCSHYIKKERSWVCDPCCMSRVLKTGTLDWFHNNIRSRFKRFGSAKVMRSLSKRLNGEQGLLMDLRDNYDGHEEDEALDGQRYRMMRKTKRLLSVHPLDFDMEQDCSSHSRRQSVQVLEEQYRPRNDPEFNTEVQLHYSRRKSLDKLSRYDEGHFPDHRIMRTRSLSKIGTFQRYPHCEPDTSEEEGSERFPMFQLPPRRRSRASSQENVHQSVPPMTELSKRMEAIESLLSRLEQKMIEPPQQLDSHPAVDLEEVKLSRKLQELTGNISDKGLSSEEDEPKVTPTHKETQRKDRVRGEPALVSPMAMERVMSSSSDEQQSDAQKRSSAAALCDITTVVLRTINATERALTELAPSKPNDTYRLMGTDVRQADEAYRTLEENVYLTAGKSYDLERKLKSLEQSAKSRYCGYTDSELSELEDKVALAAARVQTTESEVSDIENRIAALSMAEVSEKSRKKVSGAQRRMVLNDAPARSGNGSGSIRRRSFI